MHLDLKKRASSVGITQILRPKRAKKLRSFRKISGRRAHKNCVNSASVVAQTAELRCIFSFESVCVLMQDYTRVQRRDHAKFTQKSGEQFAKFPEIRHAPRTKSACTRPACAIHYSTTSLRVDRVIFAFRSEKESVRRGDYASFAPNSRERNFKVSEKVRRAARTKVA